MVVAVQLSLLGSYLPPVFRRLPPDPPQTIMLLLVQTAVWLNRAVGASVVVVAIQLSVPGLYLPPVLKLLSTLVPPQTIISISVPLQTPV